MKPANTTGHRSRFPWYDSGMTRYEKIAISLPSHAAEGVRRAVREGRAPSVSAYVASAIEEKNKQYDLKALLDEMLEETGGPLTPAERRAAERALGLTPKRRKRSANGARRQPMSKRPPRKRR